MRRTNNPQKLVAKLTIAKKVEQGQKIKISEIAM